MHLSIVARKMLKAKSLCVFISGENDMYVNCYAMIMNEQILYYFDFFFSYNNIVLVTGIHTESHTHTHTYLSNLVFLIKYFFFPIFTIKLLGSLFIKYIVH